MTRGLLPQSRLIEAVLTIDFAVCSSGEVFVSAVVMLSRCYSIGRCYRDCSPPLCFCAWMCCLSSNLSPHPHPRQTCPPTSKLAAGGPSETLLGSARTAWFLSRQARSTIQQNALRDGQQRRDLWRGAGQVRQKPLRVVMLVIEALLRAWALQPKRRLPGCSMVDKSNQRGTGQ